MSQKAQPHQVSGTRSPPQAELFRLLEENLRLQKRIDAMADEIAWLKRLHEQEMACRERELALRERTHPTDATDEQDTALKSAAGASPVADMQAILEATLSGMAAESNDALVPAEADAPSAVAPAASSNPNDTAPAAETASATADALPDIPAFLVEQPSQRKALSLAALSSKAAGNQPPKAPMLAPRRRGLAGLAGLIG